jgi:ABC-type multidrug transport system fused ATPase/permease subunit
MNRSDNGKLNKEELTQILDRTASWSENCDNKASIILGVVGVVLAILLSAEYVEAIGELMDSISVCATFGNVSLLILIILAFLTCLAGIVFLIKSLTASIKIEEFSKRGIFTDSRIFFSTIANNPTFAAYDKKLSDTDEGLFLKDLKSQIYICSIICDRKFRNYNRGLYLSMIGIGVLMLLAVIRLITG